MTNNQEIDKNFSGRLNILRAGVLGANDGIISIAGVVIGVASATESVWIIFLSGLAAVFAGAFSMAGGEYVSVSTQKDTEKAAVARERVLLTKNPEIARQSLYAAYIQNGECETSAQLLTNRAFLKNPLFFRFFFVGGCGGACIVSVSCAAVCRSAVSAFSMVCVSGGISTVPLTVASGLVSISMSGAGGISCPSAG